jgi:hypothetical protein
VSARSRPWAALAATAAAALAAAACPEFDFQSHSFACASEMDCLYMSGEECVQGHCVACASGDCEAGDAGVQGCPVDGQCGGGLVCLANKSGGNRCAPACSADSDCAQGLACKLERNSEGTAFVTACLKSGPSGVGYPCSMSEDCALEASCAAPTTCRETCSPAHATCAIKASQHCELNAALPEGWGYCVD